MNSRKFVIHEFTNAFVINTFAMAGALPSDVHKMLKIRRSEKTGLPVLALSGRIDREHVSELQRALRAETDICKVVLDLGELRLVDRATVQFLGACEASGIKLVNCPSYIREWIGIGRENGCELQC